MEMFDVSTYVTPTRFSGLSGVFLARAIIDAAPDEPSERAHAALVTVRDRAEALRAVARERMRTSPRNLRPFDAKLDAGWVGLRETIEAKSRLEGTEVAQQALELARVLFPDGTNFVRNAYREQWAASQLHLERIEEEGLGPQIEAIAGDEYLPYIQSAHDAFGEALGLGEESQASPESDALQVAINELALAIAEYGRILVGELDRADAASVAAFRRAMAPIDEQRATSRPRRAGEEPEPTVESGEPGEPEVNLDEPLPHVEPVQPTA